MALTKQVCAYLNENLLQIQAYHSQSSFFSSHQEYRWTLHRSLLSHIRWAWFQCKTHPHFPTSYPQAALNLESHRSSKTFLGEKKTTPKPTKQPPPPLLGVQEYRWNSTHLRSYKTINSKKINYLSFYASLCRLFLQHPAQDKNIQPCVFQATEDKWA